MSLSYENTSCIEFDAKILLSSVARNYQKRLTIVNGQYERSETLPLVRISMKRKVDQELWKSFYAWTFFVEGKSFVIGNQQIKEDLLD